MEREAFPVERFSEIMGPKTVLSFYKNNLEFGHSLP